MTAEPGREFRNRPASPARMRPSAHPAGAFIRDAASGDPRFYVPLLPAAWTRPLWISPAQNRWCEVLMVVRAGLVNRHRHEGQVFAYTISGRWGFLEHDWVATAGDWIYEAPGVAHAGGLRAQRADEGHVQRHRPADLAGRER